MAAKGGGGMAESIHNHRQRMKEQFMRGGVDAFNDHQLMELLLFFGIPQGDTNPVAHALIDRFGSVNGVLEASLPQLMEVKGIGEHSAVLLSLCGQLVRRCGQEARPIGVQLQTPEEFGQFFLPRFFGEQNELVMLVSLNHRHEVLNCSVITRGSVNATEINLRLILQQALFDNATSAVIAHNHPSGHALPSRADIDNTVVLADFLATAGITLLDHIIIADNDFVSMKETPTLKHIFKTK